MTSRFVAGVSVAVLLASVTITAQEPVKPAAGLEALFKDANPKLQALKQVAYHIERDLLQCNHWDEAEKWLTDRYIHHNRLAGPGRAGVVNVFSSRPRAATCQTLDAPIVAVLAEGDLVTVVSVSNRKDSKGEAYTTTWFDMWRIAGGKADEHWDPMMKP